MLLVQLASFVQVVLNNLFLVLQALFAQPMLLYQLLVLLEPIKTWQESPLALLVLEMSLVWLDLNGQQFVLLELLVHQYLQLQLHVLLELILSKEEHVSLVQKAHIVLQELSAQLHVQ